MGIATANCAATLLDLCHTWRNGPMPCRYKPLDFIPWHCDHAAFGDTIVVFVFGEERPVKFRRRHGAFCGSLAGQIDSTEDTYDLLIPHGGSYTLTGDARHIWEHSVPPGHGMRYSLTFRTRAKIAEGI